MWIALQAFVVFVFFFLDYKARQYWGTPWSPALDLGMGLVSAWFVTRFLAWAGGRLLAVTFRAKQRLDQRRASRARSVLGQ